MQYSHRMGLVVPFASKFKKQLILAVAALFVAAFATFTLQAKAIEAPTWTLEPGTVITFVCGGNDYMHTIDTVVNGVDGNFTGTGYYNTNNDVSWDIEGNVSGSELNFTVEYNNINSGYTVSGVDGVINNDGSVSGNATGNCELFTMDAGSAAPYCYDVSTSKGNLTARQVGGDVTGDLNAVGCDIGVYYDTSSGNVDGANIHDANQYGVFVDGVNEDVEVNVTNSTVMNIGHHDGVGEFDPNGVQTGLGIYYYAFGTNGSVMGRVNGNEISQYQKGGIAINGENASVKVDNNEVNGLDPVPFIAQNGIQFGYGAKGQVMENIVDGNSYEGENWVSTGILLFETSGVVVSNNEVMNSQSGIAAQSWCWYVKSADNNKIVGNTVNESEYGISVYTYSYTPYSKCDATANNNKITNNKVVNDSSTGVEGVSVGSLVYFFGSFEPEADNNKVIRNNISGFETDIEQSGDTTTKVHANVLEP